MRKRRIDKFILSLIFVMFFVFTLQNEVSAASLSISPNKVSGSSTKTGKTSNIVFGESITYSIKHYHGGDHEKHAETDGYLRGGVYKVTICRKSESDSSVTLTYDLDTAHDNANSASEVLFNQTVTQTKSIPSGWQGKTGWIEIWMISQKKETSVIC